MQHTKQKLVLVISDLHEGSIWSPIPDRMVRHDGQVIRPSDVQKWLNKQWYKLTGSALAYIGTRPFDLVLNGDMVEGVHHRSTEHWSADAGDHHLAAWIMLNPIAERAKNIYVVSGTECHDGPSGAAGLGNRLGAVKNPKTRHGAFQRLNLCVNDVYCRFVHHMPASSRIALYATQLGVMLAEHQSQAARLGRKGPRVLVQGHRHTHGYYGDSHALSVSCPPWQLLTTHGHKVATAANPCVGCVVLDFAVRGELPAVRSFVRAVPDE